MLIFATSDTHRCHGALNFQDAEPDILIHAGDACVDGTPEELKEFFEWLSLAPGARKIFVPGNHDKWLDSKDGNEWVREYCRVNGIDYLCGDGVEIGGVKFWGGPWVPHYGEYGFMRHEEYRRDMWEMIPEDVEVLITHCPPCGVLDGLHLHTSLGMASKHVGCQPLRDRIAQLHKLKAHIFGHVHVHGGEHITLDGVNFYNVAALNKEASRKLVLDDIRLNVISLF